MSPGHSKMPSNSIKVVLGRSKLRVESSNPVARGNPIPRPSKVKLITPEEAMKLSSGVNQVAVPPVSEPPRPKPAPATSEGPSPVPARPTSEPPRPKPAPATSEGPSPVPARPTSEPPRPIPARPAVTFRKEIVCALPASSVKTTTARQRTNPSSFLQSTVNLPPSPRALQIRSRLKQQTANATHTEEGGLPASSVKTTTVRQRTNPSSFLQSTVDLPPSPRALQIRARVKQQAANATHTEEGTVVEVGDKAKDHGAKETCQSTSSDERISELLLYRPALNPTWKGRIVDSATLPEFDCEFWANPASNSSRKALRLSKAMPTLLKVELLPTGHILNEMFDRSPRLSDVELYLFSEEKETERSKREHAHLFEAMATRNAMIKVNINGTELLLFSSKLLDETSQFFIKTQKKTENYLWGFFNQNKISQALVPGTSNQTDKNLDEGDVVDMDIDTEYPTPDLALKLIAESQSIPSSSPVEVSREVSLPPGFENTSRSPGKVKEEVSLPPGFENPSRSPGKVKEEVSLPPGFEKIWAPPSVTLNIHGTSNALSGLTGSDGLVRNQSRKWVFGYSRCHKNISEVAAVLLAIYHGLKLLWDSGCRRIRLETTSLEVVGALTAKSYLFCKRKSILGLCKDMILKNWECDIYHISKEQNTCAEWLASRLEGHQIQGLAFFEYPPRGLVDLLEKDRLAAAR